jgi:predicted rRNA methylase YqxC with S4 and FtsJ domains
MVDQGISNTVEIAVCTLSFVMIIKILPIRCLGVALSKAQSYLTMVSPSFYCVML